MGNYRDSWTFLLFPEQETSCSSMTNGSVS